MAKGYERSKQRGNKVSIFGKDLARRSKSKCELCGEGGLPLRVYEVQPAGDEPDKERCMFLCERCIDAIERLDKMTRVDLMFLNNSIWSEVEIVKAYSIALLRKIEEKNPWADDILDMVYMDEELEALVSSIEI